MEGKRLVSPENLSHFPATTAQKAPDHHDVEAFSWDAIRLIRAYVCSDESARVEPTYADPAGEL